MTPKIIFASTAYGPLWAPVVASWISCVGHTARRFAVEQTGDLCASAVTDRMYTHSAQNALVQAFLESDATHLFFTEMDMILPNDAIIKLLEMDKDIASGVYFLRNGLGQPCLYMKGMTTKDNPYTFIPVSVYPQDKIFKADCPGLGCVLFKRSVFEKVKFPWFDLKEAGYGSDMYFYTKAKWAEIEVWCNPQVTPEQIEYKVWSKKDYAERFKIDPKLGATGFVIQ